MMLNKVFSMCWLVRNFQELFHSHAWLIIMQNFIKCNVFRMGLMQVHQKTIELVRDKEKVKKLKMFRGNMLKPAGSEWNPSRAF